MNEKPFTVLSWGAGLQSTALGVMVVMGDLPAPDLILHADLHWESRATRQYREFYHDYFTRHGLDVQYLDVGDIRQKGAMEHVHMPFWTHTGGPLRRQCTRHFKIRPMRRHVRKLLGFPASKAPHPPAGAVENWIGFTWDEMKRVKPSRVQYAVNRWPLLEKRMTRNDCADYLANHGLPVPVKSSCIGCPYAKASDFLRLYHDESKSFHEAVEFDHKVRLLVPTHDGLTRTDEVFVYRHLEPLAAADLERDAAREQYAKQLPLFCDFI
jgi:hypothetical protein